MTLERKRDKQKIGDVYSVMRIKKFAAEKVQVEAQNTSAIFNRNINH